MSELRKALVSKRVAELVQLRHDILNRPIPSPTVSYYTKGTALGWAHAHVGRGEFRVRFHADLLQTDEGFALLIDEVIPHEVAHIICFAAGLSRNHDAAWQTICKALGGSGKARSATTLQLTKRQLKTYTYQDTAGKVRKISARRHSLIQKRGYTYRYRDNGARLTAAQYIGVQPHSST